MHLVLTVAGTTLEVVGLMLVVAEATRARCDEYGDLSLHLKAHLWFRRVFRRDLPSSTVKPERRPPDKFEVSLALAEPQALKSRMDAEASRRTIERRSALAREVNGAYMFMVGAILSGAANLV